LQGAVYRFTSRVNAQQVIFLLEKDFADFLYQALVLSEIKAESPPHKI
jgi:hypothetical protein